MVFVEGWGAGVTPFVSSPRVGVPPLDDGYTKAHLQIDLTIEGDHLLREIEALEVEKAKVEADLIDAYAALRPTETAVVVLEPRDVEPTAKLAYNSGYKPWDWTFMTGVYMDDLDAVFRDDAWQAAGILVAVGIALTLIVSLVVRNVERLVGDGSDNFMAKFRLSVRIVEGP